ncbi:MAG: hypothetical protein LBU70_09385 [Chitinispirillales bacterium]|jgi:hypothetical protein|nr:hypothetical protein [Chitinispirillales bacterium]
MSGKTLTLKKLMQALTEATAHANNALRSDYAAQMRKRSDRDFIPAPRPLGVESMKVTFTANVRDDEHTSFLESGEDICLDFGSPHGNFKGEILLKPYTSSLNAAYEYDDDVEPSDVDSEPNDGEEEAYASAQEEIADEVPSSGEGFECSGIY